MTLEGGGENPLGEEIILARLSFNPPRRPRGVAAQLRPIVFDRWSVPPLHVAASHVTYHKVVRVGFSGQKQAMSWRIPTPGELLRARQRYQRVLLHAAQAHQPTAVRARLVFPAPSTRAGVPT